MAKQLTWRKAIETVLKKASGAMHYRDITDQIIESNLRKSLGATPSTTISARLSTRIKNEGSKCPWQKIGRGLYVWKAKAGISTELSSHPPVDEENEDEEQYAVVSSFGMFWNRDKIKWNSNPKILGMQQINAEAVNFSEQIGIYLLYDGREAIYVGRATERSLGTRLYEHTHDRLSSRWNRFSWFGFRPISDAGKLETMPRDFASSSIIPAVEAMLIESLEPRQNRKRGDDLAAVEFIQKLDPEIEADRAMQAIKNALKL